MKKKIILFLSAILFTIITSCNGKNSSNGIGNTSDGQESLSESSLLGAWKYEDSYYGTIFMQFEVDGLIKVFYANEGDVLEVGNWQLQDNKVLVTDCALFKELIILDFNGNSFNISPTNYDASTDTNTEFISVERLLDEAGEPILHYSLFDKAPVADPRYGDQESNLSSQQNSSSETLESTYNAFQCSTCGYISNGTNEPSPSAFDNCKDNNGVRIHNWHEINLNGHGVQCRYCGLKCYEPIHPVAYSFDGCSRGNGHAWTDF